MKVIWLVLILVPALLILGCTSKQDRSKELLQAVKSGDREAVEELIGDGANLDVRDEQGQTPLLLTIKDHPDIARLLIENGADLNARLDCRRHPKPPFLTDLPEFGASPLQLAIYHHPDLAFLMLEKGADVNIPGESGITPLQAAVETQRSALVKDLLARGADVNAKNSLDYTALHFAVVNGPPETVRQLLAAGADVNARTTTKYGNGGETPLYYAVFMGDKNIVEMLIRADADVNARDGCQGTPLHRAAAGITIYDKDTENQTRFECKASHLRIAEMLITNGAKINAWNREWKTPLQLARELGHDKMVRLLRKKGGRGSWLFSSIMAFFRDVEEWLREQETIHRGPGKIHRWVKT